MRLKNLWFKSEMAAMVVSGLVTCAADAAPITYLRFENGTADTAVTVVPSGQGSVLDSAGGDDDFAAFAAGNAPTYRALVPGGVVPQTGLANVLSLDMRGGKDVYAEVSGPLRSATLSTFTIEAWVRFETLTGFQTIVGRDDTGNPGTLAGGESLLYLQKINTNVLRFLAPNAAGTYVSIADTTPVVANQWYHVAVVGDGTNVTLFKDGSQVASAAFAGGLYDPAVNTIWTVGRGQYNGGVADFVAGYIDEVRWSDTALTPSEFLNVPEPSGLGLLLAGGLLVLRRRQRA